MSKDFKVGDKVYVVVRSYGGGIKLESVSADIIKNITPKRGVVKLTESSKEFTLDGSPAKYERWAHYSTSLEYWSPELATELRVLKILKNAQKVTFEKVVGLTDEQHIALYDILKVFEDPK
jgi:hypothetical protein